MLASAINSDSDGPGAGFAVPLWGYMEGSIRTAPEPFLMLTFDGSGLLRRRHSTSFTGFKIR